MTDSLPAADTEGAAQPAPRSAGAWLKAAREREGLHLAVLAATIKVAPAKLQALEADRFDELPNATFTRALAQSVCRCLKIDPRPVLALLPRADAQALDTPVGKLNEPFEPRTVRADAPLLARVSKPMFIAGGVLLLAALVVGLLPRSVIESLGRGELAQAGSALPAASAAAATAAASALASAIHPAQTHSAAPAVPAVLPASAALPAPAVAAPAASAARAAATLAAAGSSPAAGAAALLGLHASADSWIEVVDAQQRIVFSRVLHAGESAQVDGALPLRLRVGNVGATTVTLRGQQVDLAPHARVNVARLELR